MNNDSRDILRNSLHSSYLCGVCHSLSQDSADTLNGKLQEEKEEMQKLQEDGDGKHSMVVDHGTGRLAVPIPSRNGSCQQFPKG